MLLMFGYLDSFSLLRKERKTKENETEKEKKQWMRGEKLRVKSLFTSDKVKR